MRVRIELEIEADIESITNTVENLHNLSGVIGLLKKFSYEMMEK